MTQKELRAFASGTIYGLVATVVCFAFVCWLLGVKWQPVFMVNQ